MTTVPEIRIRKANRIPLNPGGDYVLYWMIAFRRTGWNHSLQRAVEWARELKKPLVILEALRVGYGWASERFHRFILDGMAENARRLSKYHVLYYPYVEPRTDADKGLLAALSRNACLVVSDDFPAFFLPRMVSSVSRKVPVLLEVVDSNGLLPMRAADRVFPTAYAFRRFLQKELPSHLQTSPGANPLKGVRLPAPAALPDDILKRWPPASPLLLRGDPESLASLPIDHNVAPVERPGGPGEAQRGMRAFLKTRLSLYPENRNHPDEEGTSGLSPYLHFGHISAHQIFHELTEKEEWTIDHLSGKATGSRTGWWRMGEAAEAFLDELITWRELGFNMCRLREDYDRYESLPDWARKTLRDHEKDPRPYVYALQDLEEARTHDPLWNAAQRQLVEEGRIHNYLRMLWGKKILEWSPSPREALDILIELNNKYALDGRDPNSYSGIFWILGRYDRAWGPERSIFGKIRYMSSGNTARKLRVSDYLIKYGP